MKTAIPPEIEKHLRDWNIIASLHRIAHVFLGLVGVLCPLVIAAFADCLSISQVRLISFSGAASIAIFAGFEIGNLATRFREAWKMLNAAKFRYEACLIDLDGLIKVYEDGEKCIGQIKPDPFRRDTANQASDATSEPAPVEGSSAPQG